MLLRRITEHVKAQNWLAVGIDFLIVVIGVFVGLQVSNWNDARSLNSKSALFTERLKSDLRYEAWNYQYLIEYFDDVQTSGYRALNALTGNTQLSDEALLINAYRATQYLVNYRSRSTFDELTSTGALDLIHDENLRNTALWVYNTPVFEDTALGSDSMQYRELFRMLVPLEVQDALLEKCGDPVVEAGDFESIIDSLDYPCETGLPSELLAEVANTLHTETSMVSLLRLRIANVKTYSTYLTLFNLDSRFSLQTIAEEKP
ncbi:MAG: hypothetical protein GXP04_14350 [Alphaproteobacteria bacterium]|nr:hypothetical protein [Alphaproteobacteria bacterium]